MNESMNSQTNINSMSLEDLQELYRNLALLEQHDRHNLIDSVTLTQTQEAFLMDTSDIKLFSGGNGSGKTAILVIDCAKQMMGEHPLQKTGQIAQPPVFVRAMSPSLTDTVDKVLRPEFEKWIRADYIDHYDSKHRILYLKENCPAKGSRVEFMSYDQDIDVYGGGDRGVLACDEPPPKDVFNESRARLRERFGRTLIGMTPVKTNPYVRWVFMELVEPRVASVYYGGTMELLNLRFGSEAETISERMFGHLTTEEKQYRMYGKFPTLGGLIYKVVKAAPPSGHLVNPFDIPKDWMILMSLDYHPRKACHAVWCAVSPKDVHFYFMEYISPPNRTISQMAEDIDKMENGRIPYVRFIDPSSAQPDRVDEYSCAQVRFARYKSGGRPIIFRPATRDVNMGVEAVTERLRFDKEGRAGMYFIRGKVDVTLDQMLHYVWDENQWRPELKDPKEKPMKKDDEGPDCVRYIEVARIPYKHPALTILREQTPEEMAREITRRNQSWRAT